VLPAISARDRKKFAWSATKGAWDSIRNRTVPDNHSVGKSEKLASNHYILGNEKLASAIQTYDVYDLNNSGSRQLKHF
jgi:hypothetical protein